MHKVVVIQRCNIPRKGIEKAFRNDPELFHATSFSGHPEVALDEARKKTPLVVVSGLIFEACRYTGKDLAREVKILNPNAIFVIFSGIAHHEQPDDVDIVIDHDCRTRDFDLLAAIVGELARGEPFKLVEYGFNKLYFRPLTKEEKE